MLAKRIPMMVEFSSELVLVVDDDALVGEHIADSLASRGCLARHVADYDEALRIARSERPAVLVLDQIVETPQSQRLLRQLESLGAQAPWVVLVRFAPGPTGPFRDLQVTVVAGEEWFEQLPDVVSRHVYARAW